MTMKTIKDRAREYSERVYGKYIDSHTDFRAWDYKRGYADAMDIWSENAFLDGEYDILSEVCRILDSEDSHVGKIAELRNLVQQMKGQKND